MAKQRKLPVGCVGSALAVVGLSLLASLLTSGGFSDRLISFALVFVVGGFASVIVFAIIAGVRFGRLAGQAVRNVAAPEVRSIHRKDTDSDGNDFFEQP